MEEGDETKVREKITVLQADTDRRLMPSHSWYEKLVPGAPSCKFLGTLGKTGLSLAECITGQV